MKKLLLATIRSTFVCLFNMLLILATPILLLAWLAGVVVHHLKPQKYDTICQDSDTMVRKFRRRILGHKGKYTPIAQTLIQGAFNEAERAMKCEMEKYPASKMRVEKQLNALTTIRGYFASKRWDISEYLE